MKLDVKAFTLASGIVSGISSLVIVLFAVLTGRGPIWMLIYGLIVDTSFAFVYNSFAKE